MLPSAALSIALLGIIAQAKVLRSATDLDVNEAFDFIVVGSGPGGATVASRLSETPKFNVLLLEAGSDSEGIEILRVPGQSTQIPSVYQWNYTTVASAALNNRSLTYKRGYVLGGTTSINAMVYSRGAADDYESWVNATGDESWSWDALRPYFAKNRWIWQNERLVAPTGKHNVSGEYDPRLHTENGQVFVSLPSQGPTEFDERCLGITKSQSEFPFLLDMNDGRPNGLAWQQMTIGNGERSSAATAYLGPSVRRRPNLTILLNTQVEIGDKATQEILKNLTAIKEVVLSAGVFGTPQILLNSGIGNASELRSLGIEPIHELPEVGKGLADHTRAFTLWNVHSQDPKIDPSTEIEEWRQNKTGPMATTPLGRLILWSRIPSNSSLWSSYPDPASGPHTPHLEVILRVIGGNTAGGSISFLNSPSRGSVTLRSSNPFDDPIIDDGNLQSPIDIAAFREGFRLVKRFFSGPQWTSPSSSPTGPYLISPLFLDPDSTTDAAFEASLRQTADTGLHGVGTAAMGMAKGQRGVVDAQLRVKGVDGLRVVDASAIPRVPAGHTQVPVYVLAERAADLIKASWL